MSKEKKKEKPLINSDEKLKAFGIIKEDDNDDIEIDGEQATGGKDTTVDTHWPTRPTGAGI
ncbi:hypothetical protein [Pedobacter caeni]|uniref:Uncharacterized protein n=1 Tax=Pedobacter caeni TaxID=288992 RepID=A0A1M5M385_9SPHI|nr:hypothetical protein [Pedobacter caeni]SHG71774.1 hypothetical protein SAMN04488522_10750 [Pedobacter caeni]